MKKTNMLLLGLAGASIALAVYLYIIYRKERRGNVSTGSGAQTLAANVASFPDEPFTGLNWYTSLQLGSKGWEVIALQRMLQYYDPSVSVTGVISDKDAAVIYAVTGRSVTNLNEFRYEYFSIRFGDDTAQRIFESVNGQ